VGSWAVAGFFGISGYLIPRARLRTDLVTYVFRRARRIYPGFWAACTVVAFVFTPFVAHVSGRSYDPATAALYVVRDISTYMAQETIGAGNPRVPPDLIMANAPAWTLLFELMCYALVGAMLTLEMVRRRAGLTALALYSVSAATAIATTNQHGVAWFTTLFAAGWVMGTVGDRMVVTSARIGLALAVAAAAALAHPVLAMIPLAYAVLGGGALLPARWFTSHDVSYGTYLYGWPIQQLLVALGLTSLTELVPAAVVLALAAGTASWFLVERRCLHRARPAGGTASNTLRLSRRRYRTEGLRRRVLRWRSSSRQRGRRAAPPQGRRGTRRTP
jgi:peptidoglycan/LPS O-acetylase OafA/YrhL